METSSNHGSLLITHGLVPAEPSVLAFVPLPLVLAAGTSATFLFVKRLRVSSPPALAVLPAWDSLSLDFCMAGFFSSFKYQFQRHILSCHLHDFASSKESLPLQNPWPLSLSILFYLSEIRVLMFVSSH